MRYSWLFSLALLTLTPAVHAGWEDNFQAGRAYAGKIELGRVGSRKEVLLPASQGEWIFLSYRESTLVIPHNRNTTASVSTQIGELAFAERIGGRITTLLQVRASISPAIEGNWPYICRQAPESSYRETYPRYSSTVREKCLAVETAPTTTLTEQQKALLQPLAVTATQPMRATASITSRRDGLLAITVTALSPTADEPERKAFIDWARVYAEQLEDALSHSLDDNRKASAIPLTALPAAASASAAPASATSSSASTPTAARHDDTLRLIERLKELRDNKVLTEEEFQQKKQELLKRL